MLLGVLCCQLSLVVEDFFLVAFRSQVGILIGLLPSIIPWELWHRHCMVRMEGKKFKAIAVIRLIRGSIIEISQ